MEKSNEVFPSDKRYPASARYTRLTSLNKKDDLRIVSACNAVEITVLDKRR